MNQPKSNNSEVGAEQAASKKHQTIKLGLDVHAATIVVAQMLDHSAPQPAQKFTPAQFLVWIQTQLALADTVHSCYEAGPRASCSIASSSRWGPRAQVRGHARIAGGTTGCSPAGKTFY